MKRKPHWKWKAGDTLQIRHDVTSQLAAMGLQGSEIHFLGNRLTLNKRHLHRSFGSVWLIVMVDGMFAGRSFYMRTSMFENIPVDDSAKA